MSRMLGPLYSQKNSPQFLQHPKSNGFFPPHFPLISSFVVTPFPIKYKLEHSIPAELQLSTKLHNTDTAPIIIATGSGSVNIRYPQAAKSVAKNNVAKSRKHTKARWLRFPMQLFINGQWWSMRVNKGRNFLQCITKIRTMLINAGIAEATMERP